MGVPTVLKLMLGAQLPTYATFLSPETVILPLLPEFFISAGQFRPLCAHQLAPV